MILELAAVVAVAVAGVAGYFALKHYGSAKVVAAVKAEISKIEQEAKALVGVEEAKVGAVVASITARLKALL